MPPRPTLSADVWPRYRSNPAFVLGFHGCDHDLGEQILAGQSTELQPSENEYDWLGHGIYAWQNDPQRALEFAIERARGAKNSKGVITKPFVLGIVMDLGYCLDLNSRAALEEVRDVQTIMLAQHQQSGLPFPQNNAQAKRHNLDCAVLNLLHQLREIEGKRPYDSVRATFFEGTSIYPTSAFRFQDHIQICLRNPQNILAYFRPLF